MSQNRLYFGYGSNLDWKDWSKFCSKRHVSPYGLKERGPAWLVRHHLKFHYHSSGRGGGAADVVPVDGHHATPGALFDVDESAWRTLVSKEGAPHYYEEKEVLVIDQDGLLHHATTFVVCKERRKPHYVQPTDEYRCLIQNGLEHRGLPITGLEQAMQHSFEAPTIRHLFVYGTLMTGQTRFNQIEPFIESIQPASVKGKLYHLVDYPGLKIGNGLVHGELIEMSEHRKCLERMDQIEGFLGFGETESLYDRTIIQISTNEGTVWAWTYVYAKDVDEDSLIISGRWA